MQRILSAWAWVAAVSTVLFGFLYVGAVWLVTAPFDPGRYHAGRAFRQLAVAHGFLTRLWRFETEGRPPEGPRRPYVVVSFGLVAGLVASRASTLVVQSRLIALEMRLRLAATLPPEMRGRISELRLKQLVGLRFAGDAELPLLMQRCLDGELTTADAVKREIRDWRPDFLRA